MKLISIFFFLIAPMVCAGALLYPNLIWNKFIANPEKSLFHSIATMMITNTSTHCSKKNLPNATQLAQILILVQNGNEYALRLGILISKCLGVGDQEDFYRSSGIFFERQPKVLLQIATEGRIAEHELNYMVTMLPLGLVDNIDGQIAAINKRIDILNQINDTALIKIKKLTLAFLENEKLDLKKIRADGNPPVFQKSIGLDFIGQ